MLFTMPSMTWSPSSGFSYTFNCLTREANNDGIHQHELQPNSADKIRPLLNLVCDLFEKGSTKSRSLCFRTAESLEGILKNVHPYFGCLKPLLLKLHWALYLGHQYEGVEHYNIHSVVLAILKDTITKLKEHQNEQEILEAKENRQKKWMKWRAMGQVPNTDEESDHPLNIGGYSPLSDAKNDPLLHTMPNKPLVSPIPLRRSKRQKGEPAYPIRR